MSSISGGGFEVELAQAPTDGISSVHFSPTSDNLLVTSWDKTTQLYDVPNNMLKAKFTQAAPVLDCCFSDASHGFSGGLEQQVHMHDFASNSDHVIGSHDAAIKAMAFSSETGLVYSGSWDQTVRTWDPRTPRQMTSSLAHPDKVYSMSISGNNLVVATAGRHVWVWDVRNTSSVQQRRESALKYQTRSVRASKDSKIFALSSIEGRVAVEFFDTSPDAQKNKFAFKCHRKKDGDKETIYPVNALAFHPHFGTFASGGSDGVVNMWDPRNRKRLWQSRTYPTSIAALDFNSDGSLLAIASSYLYEEGEKDKPADSIFVLSMSESQAKPKDA